MMNALNKSCPTYIRLVNTDNPKFRIAVVEDNELYNHLLSTGLKNHIKSLPNDNKLNIQVDSYTKAKNAFSELDESVDMVFLDYYLEDSITGLEILKKVKRLNPDCKVIIISQINNSKTSLDTLREGANDFIYKDPMTITTSCRIAAQVITQRLKLV
jgi:PleD family two-component response regulator